jgi:RHS repeat-associated protein
MKCIHNRVSFAIPEGQALIHSRAGQKVHQFFRCGVAAITYHLRKSVCIALILSLLATSTPAAPQTIVGFAKETSVDFAFWFRASGWRHTALRLIKGQDSNGKGQEKQEERDLRVTKIQIYPGDVTVKVEERITFAAVAYDKDGNAIGGVKMSWSALDEGRNHLVHLTQEGDFESTAPGKFKVIVESAGKRAQAKVTVIDGSRRSKKGTPLGTRPVSTRDVPNSQSARNVTKQKDEKSAHASIRRSARASSAGPRKTGKPMSPQILPLDGWGSDNYTSADDPGNRRGDPPGAAVDNGAGSGNFQLAAPILGSSGRGIDISLGLAYNSRLWNKAGSNINFDIDRDWPAPGWSLGFGKVVDMGSGGSMIVDADGTRHSFNGKITPFSYGELFEGHTADGTLIDYATWKNASGVMTWAEVNLPNGSQIHYNCQGPGGMFPTQIIDANGNYITITYVNNTGPRIQTVTDTLGRVISFQYDIYNLLTAVTTPGLGGGTRTLVRLHYHQISLNSTSYSFSGLTAVVRDPNPWVIDAIYYPGTSTGYWFGDSDSYSTYGMLAKVVEQRGMGFSAASLNEQGIVTQGQMTRKETYNYPLYVGDGSGTASSGLTDAPTYSSCTETWTRDGSLTDQAVTNYEVHQESTPRTVTITLPNGTKTTQYSYNYSSLADSDPLKALDGLVYRDETYVTSGTVLQSSTATWEKGAYDSPRPTRIEATNERNQTTATEFSYGTLYNQVIEVRNYDYGGTTLLRSTRTQYQNSASYTAYSIHSNNAGRHIFNLPLLVEVYAGDNVTRVSRTEYQYDGQTLTNTPGVVMHADNHNPYAPQYPVQYCAEYDEYYINCVRWDEYYTSDYNPITDYRGNVTQVTTYADAATPGIPINESRRYDITGNLVTASTSCCQQTSINYTTDTQYAYPQSQTRGSATDAYAQVTTSGTYDFNTGLPLSATDANGRTSQTSYFIDTLRAQTSTLPSGAHTDYAYDDAGMSVTETTYLEAHPTHTTIADQNVKLLNGRGQVRQEKALGANSVWDFVDTIFDSMGRVAQQTRPYRSGDQLQWTTPTYDALSRVTMVTAPDGSTTQTFYNEASRPDVASGAAGETTRVVDAWGRERWGRADTQGRLVEVVEPNPAGNGSVASGGLLTTYSYNTLGNLTGVAQGDQTRAFKYDSLGRLLAQKLAETSATLNDSGQYQTSGGTWSDVFTYDDRSNLTSRTDARGVKTVYNYNGDPLNRLQSVSWDTSGFGDSGHPILDAATVSYQYRTKSSSTQLLDIGQLSSVNTSGVSTESYSYDSENRVSGKTLTLTSRPSYPFATNYIYDALDRITDIQYPAEYGNGTQPRKVVHQDYDIASRLSKLTVDGATQASQIVYNAASQTTSLQVGASGANQITENYGYHAQTGLLENQTVTRGATTLLNLSYDYANGNGKRTGQLTKILNNLNHNKDRGYAYDALGRLTQATGGQASAPLWTQTYTYDRYGNRISVSASGYSAKLNSSDPQSTSGKRQLAMATGRAGVSPAMSAQREQGSSPSLSVSEGVDSTAGASNPQSAIGNQQLAMTRSHHASRSTRTESFIPQGNPPVFTDDPLVAGVTVIKAVHITELRTAIDQARARAGLAAASWAESISSSVTLIKASHITELRARLAEARTALGLSAASYTDPNLAVGDPVKAAHIQELRDRVREALNSGGCTPGQTLEQFVKNFYQGALARQPNVNELQSWTTQLRQAYYQGQTQLLAAALYLGRQLFKSAEYANRNRDNHWYVYDLYWAYGQREPDAPGWSFWEGVVNTDIQNGLDGREHARLAWEQSGEFATKISSLCPGSGGSGPIPLDGIANLSYNVATNHINTAGFAYDAAGNQTQIVRADGSIQKFKYDAANRLIQVRDGYDYVLATYTYGDSNERLIADEGGVRTYYACNASMEYVESGSSITPQWRKTYIYLSARLLSTLTPNGSGGEAVQHHHPDRLGTRLVTDPSSGTSFEQVTLPFGTALDSESTGSTKRRFTSYDRSSVTGLDYANNRHYDPQQGRFTQVDPIGMSASSLSNPQSLNMYSYVGNDPVNRTDPSGLFWGKLFKWISKALKWIGIAVLVAVVVMSGPFAPASTSILGHILGFLVHLGAVIGSAMNFVAGGVLLGEGATVASAAMLGASGLLLASMGVGAIANHLQQRRRTRGKKKARRAEVGVEINVDSLIYLSADYVLRLIKENNQSGVDDAKVLCQAYQESHPAGRTRGTLNQNTKVGSHRGLLQVGPEAAGEVGLGNGQKPVTGTSDNATAAVNPDYLKNIYDPAQNIQAGTKYLRLRIDRAGGDETKGFEGFGTGPGYADRIQKCADKVNSGDVLGGLNTIYP